VQATNNITKMKTLLILRHAKIELENNALSDHDRPLNPRGQRDAPNVGKRLRNEDLIRMPSSAQPPNAPPDGGSSSRGERLRGRGSAIR